MAAAPVGAVSTEYPSSTKFCRRESAMVGSSSTTRIRTSLFSTFFSSLVVAAPWGIMITPFQLLPMVDANRRLLTNRRLDSPMVLSGKGNYYYKLFISKLSRSAVRLDDLRRHGEFDLITSGERTKRIVIQVAQTRPLDHSLVAFGTGTD